MNLLTIKDMCKAYTDKVLFDHVDFSINENEKIGVIGINGTGKSTLLKIAAGLDTPDEGSVVKGSNVHVRYLPQNPEFAEGSTIYEYVIKANTTHGNEWMIEGEAKTILGKLGFTEYNKKLIYSGKYRGKAEIGHLQCPRYHNYHYYKYERHTASRSDCCMTVGYSDDLRLEYTVKKLYLRLWCFIIFTHRRTS